MTDDKSKPKGSTEAEEPTVSANGETREASDLLRAQKSKVADVLGRSEQEGMEPMTEREIRIFGKLDDAEQIPENEREKFKEIYFALPKKLRKRYLGYLRYSLRAKNPVHVLTKFRAYLFELTRRELVLSQELEAMEEHEHEPILVEYLGYETNQKDFTKPPHKPLGGNNFGDIENDVDGLTRNNKIYLYETKLMAIKVYGKEYGRHEAAKSRNQLLKYQTATTQGKIAGATIEIRGVVDTEFFDWMHRADTVPDLEVIYSLVLPSGAEYRFVLKEGKGDGLRFQNDSDTFSEEDLDVVKGIEAALAGDDEVLKMSVSEINLSEGVRDTMLHENDIDRPYEIDTLEKYHEYHNLRLRRIWERFKGVTR